MIRALTLLTLALLATPTHASDCPTGESFAKARAVVADLQRITTSAVKDGADYVVNGARVFYKGRPVEGADPATFRAAPEGTFRFSVDAMDHQWLYGLGQRVERNDDAGRQRQRMPR